MYQTARRLSKQALYALILCHKPMASQIYCTLRMFNKGLTGEQNVTAINTIESPKTLSQNQRDWPQLERLITSAMVQAAVSEELLKISLDITAEFIAIEEPLNQLCTQSCCRCMENCCMRATVWYDLKDLLFIYLNTGMFPSCQISRTGNGACSQLTPSGCKTGRADRPFICTWYICASQKEQCRNQKAAPSVNNVISAIKRIQSHRKELQDIFLSATSI